ncbi:MAG: esterase family protein [Planctomycetaceae bacterium]|jgi:hypothetical protein|nr:esterase family protein [Planctomycetaceae bacterium]
MFNYLKLSFVFIFILQVIGELPVFCAEIQENVAETSNIRTFLLHGQVAILWNENDHSVRQIMASDKPITETNRESARILASEILSGSANDWFQDPDECQNIKSAPRGWILAPDIAPLERTGGLFVHTFKNDDSLLLYFAVVGKEEKIQPNRNATTQPVKKNIENIRPIEQNPGVLEAMKKVSKGLPVLLYLHAHQGRPSLDMSHLIFGNEMMGWREGLPFKFMVRIQKNHIRVEPFDRVWINRKMPAEEVASEYYRGRRNIESWWFGTNNQINLPELVRKNDYVVNYTERWVLYVLDWVIDNYGADRNKIYASGTSMGTGVLRLAMNNPDRFAVVDGMVPFVDMTYDEGKPNMNNTKRFKGIWGTPSVKIDAATPIGNRVNLVQFVERHSEDLPYVIVRLGRQDYSVFWRRKPDFLRAMNNNRHGFLAAWDNGSHSTAMQKKIDHFPGFNDISWYGERFALNKSYPAISDCSLNNDAGNGEMNNGDLEGFINRGIDWKILADEPKQYRVHLFCTLDNAQYPITLSVTPRRVQQFHLSSGEKIQAEINSDSEQKQIDAVVNDKGLLTVKNVSLPDQKGCTLILRKK